LRQAPETASPARQKLPRGARGAADMIENPRVFGASALAQGLR
jgi:hypothetical protein